MLDHMHRRGLIAAAFAAAAALALPAAAQSPRQVVENAIGAADAPVTMVEYASLTCPHCASFHIDVLPTLKSEYVDTGKVRLIYREVYFDKPSLWAAMIARCAGPDRYFSVVELLFRDQQNWSRKETEGALVEALFAIGRQAGMTDEVMRSCLQDGEFAKAMVAEFQKNVEADGIEGTPTFVIDGETVQNRPWDELKALLDAEIAEASAG